MRFLSWTAFNAMLSESTQPVTTIRYLPFIHAQPTDLNTIYTALIQIVRLAESLGQEHIFVTADLSIYSKNRNCYGHCARQGDYAAWRDASSDGIDS